MTHTLILLRHGESEWNAKNLFTGWVDVDLTEKGRAEAVSGGEQLREAGLLPDVVHTSLQRRAISTAHLALDAADRHWIPVRRSWRLNERHYGALQGKDKKQTLEEYGEEQFMTWRRSFDVPPPPLPDDDEWSQAGDPRYADLGDDLPRTECLKDVIVRMLPHWESSVVPDLEAGLTVLVAAHGNSLRGIVKHLDGISDDDIAGLNIPTGMPLVYRLDDSLLADGRGGRVPRPRGGRSGRRRRRQPGSLTDRPQRVGCGRRSSRGSRRSTRRAVVGRQHVPRVVDRAPLQRQAAAADAGVEAVAQRLQRRDLLVQPAAPVPADPAPVRLGGRAPRRQPVELLADLVQRQADVRGRPDEGQPPKRAPFEHPTSARRPGGVHQSLGLVVAKCRGGETAALDDLPHRQ